MAPPDFDVPLSITSSSKNKEGLTPTLQSIYADICDHDNIRQQESTYYNSFLPSLSHDDSMVLTTLTNSSKDSKTSIFQYKPVSLDQMVKEMSCIGLCADAFTGCLKYLPSKFSPLLLSYDICYVRHGKTEGNTEPRIFQGQVDYASNFLNSEGVRQAEEAAQKLDELGDDLGNLWIPSLIVSSPLGRAKQTALPYINLHPSKPAIVVDGFKEMAFGSWDNARIEDVPIDNIAHLFYLRQNVFVKADRPHMIGEVPTWETSRNITCRGTEVDAGGTAGTSRKEEFALPPSTSGCYFRQVKENGHLLSDNGQVGKLASESSPASSTSLKPPIPSENFLEVIWRSRAALLGLQFHPLVIEASVKGKRPKVVIYGHSMSGAAISILLGHGKTNEEGFLGFDGKHIMANATPTLLLPQQPRSLVDDI